LLPLFETPTPLITIFLSEKGPEELVALEIVFVRTHTGQPFLKTIKKDGPIPFNQKICVFPSFIEGSVAL